MARESELEHLRDGKEVLIEFDEGPGNPSRTRKLKRIEEISRSDTAILLKVEIDEKECVAKVLRCEELEAFTPVAESFGRERMVLEKLEHANIVRVLYSDARL